MANFVLIHGAGTGGWLWDDVAAGLRSSGHHVHAPSLVGVGDDVADHPIAPDVSAHAEQITTELDTDGWTEVVLVGFSYGGYVITAVADSVPHRISRLVYLDAFVPQAGRSFLDILPAPVRTKMEMAARAGDGEHIPPAPVETVGGIGATEPDVSVEHVQAVLARRGRHPIATYREPMPPPFHRSAHVPRLFVSCTDKPPGDPLIAQAAALRAAGWAVHDIPTGHFAMLSMPAAITAILNDLVTPTADGGKAACAPG